MRRVLIIVVMLGLFVVGSIVLLRAGSRSVVAPPPTPDDASSMDELIADAVRDALHAATVNPDDAVLRARLASVYDANGMSPLAEETWRQAIALDETNARSWYHLACLLADRGAMDEAHDAMGRARALSPDYPPIRWRRGLWLLEAGSLDEAEVEFGAALQAAPNDPTGAVGLARVFLARDEPERAARQLEGVVRKHEELSYAQQLLGIAYQQLGREAEAEALLETSPGQLVRWPDPWRRDLEELKTGYSATIQKADRLVQAGQAEEARQTLERLRTTFPDDVVLLAKLGEVYMRTGAPDDAVPLLEQALRHDPAYFPAYLHLAQCAVQRNRFDVALQHVDRAIALNPGLPFARLLRCDILLRIEPPDFDAALAELDEAAALGERGSDIEVKRGRVLLQARRWNPALRVFEEVMQEYPEHAAAWAGAAFANAQLGRGDNARRALQRAIQLDRTDPFVRQIAGALRELER